MNKDKIKSYLNYKTWNSYFGSSASKISTLTPVFTFAGLIMPLLLGISIGWLGSVYIDYTLSPRIAEAQSKKTIKQIDSDNTASSTGLNDFLTANPFAISAFPVIDNSSVSVTPIEEPKIEVSNTFTTAVLAGTFPDIGAYLYDNTNNKLEYINLGEEFEAYTLAEVRYDRAVFRDTDENDITKYLYISSVLDNVAQNSAPTPAPAPTPPVAQADSNIVPANTDGQQGVIDRALLDGLMTNPFEEMRRFRMRPKFEGNEPVGLEIQWIQHDAILGKLGVQKNDVVKSVNGIPLRNMGDVTNAINSLMNGSRFDVEVLRGNAPMNLVYVVR